MVTYGKVETTGASQSKPKVFDTFKSSPEKYCHDRKNQIHAKKRALGNRHSTPAGRKKKKFFDYSGFVLWQEDTTTEFSELEDTSLGVLGLDGRPARPPAEHRIPEIPD